ncbi:MAG: OsmC family protein [bacterium]|nr:OsmC family protein [bacterium]
MEAKLKWIDGLTFAGAADSKHWVVMDTEESVGGHDGAAKPLELILLGLGGCTSMDVVSILRKMRVRVDKYELVLRAERSENHPKVFTSVRMEYRLWGPDLDLDKVRKAVDLSRTTYCSVSAMLSKAFPIEIEIAVNPKDGD